MNTTLLFCIIVVLLSSVAAQETVTLPNNIRNILIISPFQIDVVVAESAALSGQVTVDLTPGYVFTPVSASTILTLTIALPGSSSSSASALGNSRNRNLLFSFILSCLFLLPALLLSRTRGSFLGAGLLLIVCAIALSSATEITPRAADVTLVLTVPLGSALKCVVLAVLDNLSTANCTNTPLNCFVQTTQSQTVFDTCPCLAKENGTAIVAATSTPSTFSPMTGGVGCPTAHPGVLDANFTNTDASPSCVDIKFEFQTSSSFEFNNVLDITPSLGVVCENQTVALDTVTCNGLIANGATARVLIDYSLTSCCTPGTVNLVDITVSLTGTTTVIASGSVSITIANSCP